MKMSETFGLNVAKRLNDTVWVSLERCKGAFSWEMSMAYSWSHIEQCHPSNTIFKIYFIGSFSFYLKSLQLNVKS